MATNEQKGLDALIAPHDLTLGQVARLERIKSPLLQAKFDSLVENLKAFAALDMSAEDFVANADNLDAFALKKGDGMTAEEYDRRMTWLADGLVAFGILMPRPDEEAKKKTDAETAG
jgi:hypothetical protein